LQTKIRATQAAIERLGGLMKRSEKLDFNRSTGVGSHHNRGGFDGVKGGIEIGDSSGAGRRSLPNGV
jgi:hypothetical protein